MEKIISETKLSGNARLHTVMQSFMETILTAYTSIPNHKNNMYLILFMYHMTKTMQLGSGEVTQTDASGMIVTSLQRDYKEEDTPMSTRGVHPSGDVQ